MYRLRQAFPTRALALLLAIGFVDLIATAVLHYQGLIVEMNPLMKGFIDRSEFLFILVKAMTLVVGWYFLSRFAQSNRTFVRQACIAGSGVYVAVWLMWFFHG